MEKVIFREGESKNSVRNWHIYKDASMMITRYRIHCIHVEIYRKTFTTQKLVLFYLSATLRLNFDDVAQHTATFLSEYFISQNFKKKIFQHFIKMSILSIILTITMKYLMDWVSMSTGTIFDKFKLFYSSSVMYTLKGSLSLVSMCVLLLFIIGSMIGMDAWLI